MIPRGASVVVVEAGRGQRRGGTGGSRARLLPFSLGAMPKSLLPIVLALIAGWTGTPRAQSLTPNASVAPVKGGETLGRIGILAADSLDAQLDRTGLLNRRLFAASVTSPSGQPHTAIDYRLKSDGLSGSVGFTCTSDDPVTPYQVVNVLSGSQEGRLLGATIRYPFR